MKKFFKKKINIVALIILIIIIIYFGWIKNGKVKNDFFVVERQDLVEEISVAGKVKPVESINLAFQKTGVLSNVYVEVGQKVEKGTLLAQLDSRDAQKLVKDAEVNLANAELALEKAIIEQDQLLRGDTLNEVYEEGLANLSDFYDEAFTMLNSLEDIIFGNDLESRKENIKYYIDYDNKFSNAFSELSILYQEAEELHEEGLAIYQLAEHGGGIYRDKAIRSGHDLAVKIAEIIKLTRDIIRHFQDVVIGENAVHEKATITNGFVTNLLAYSITINSYIADSIDIINDINTYEDSTDLAPLDVKTQELLVKQKENELNDAKNNLAKYFLYSPINGVISKKDLSIGEIATANVAVIGVISDAEFEITADIYEEDVVKIETGALTEISFPSFPEKSFQGRVVFIDNAEKIVDGVVYYEVKINFDDNPPEKIKSTMTADLIIQLEKKENILVVPKKAISKSGDKTIVEISKNQELEEKEIEIGLRGYDMVEVISGIEEGEKILLK